MAQFHISKDPPEKTSIALGHKSLYGLGRISRVEEIYGIL